MNPTFSEICGPLICNHQVIPQHSKLHNSGSWYNIVQRSKGLDETLKTERLYTPGMHDFMWSGLKQRGTVRWKLGKIEKTDRKGGINE